MRQYRIICLLAMCLVAVGCNQMSNQLTNPRPWGIGETPDGPPEFRKGWEDGCDTGIGVYGDDRYKFAYTFKQDLNLLKNPAYYRAWRDAYTYCRWYAENWVRVLQ